MKLYPFLALLALWYLYQTGIYEIVMQGLTLEIGR
jgi:hypothetical protein